MKNETSPSRSEFWLGVIHLVCTQNVPKNEQFLSPDTHTIICI